MQRLLCGSNMIYIHTYGYKAAGSTLSVMNTQLKRFSQSQMTLIIYDQW